MTAILIRIKATTTRTLDAADAGRLARAPEFGPSANPEMDALRDALGALLGQPVDRRQGRPGRL